jgi:hypothetical protein
MTHTFTTTVLPGGEIRVVAPQLAEGQTVTVSVTEPAPIRPEKPKPGVYSYLQSLPPLHRTPEEWAEIERQLREDRDSWDR